VIAAIITAAVNTHRPRNCSTMVAVTAKQIGEVNDDNA
jgi:hypothetical protein